MTKYQRLQFLLAAIPVILLVPLTAMQFTDQVVWTPIDFTVMGILLLVLALAVDAGLRLKPRRKALAAVGASLLVFLFIWLHLAVGLW